MDFIQFLGVEIGIRVTLPKAYQSNIYMSYIYIYILYISFKSLLEAVTE